MNKNYEKIMDSVRQIRLVTDFKPTVAIVLGSGLGNFVEKIKVVKEIDYASIKGFPRSTVSGHQGKFIFGYIGEVKVVCMQGRVHYYEGYSTQDVVLPIRVMGCLGAEALFLTNASGGLNSDFTPGDLMLITGQISSFVPSPLIGENIDELGVRFPDMSNIYDKNLREYIQNIAKTMEIKLQQGVYLQVTGPNYESPEEIRMFKILGADAVGMSTAIEAIIARHTGMRVAGISLITNYGAGLSSNTLSHEEVKQTAEEAREKFEKLMYGVVSNYTKKLYNAKNICH